MDTSKRDGETSSSASQHSTGLNPPGLPKIYHTVRSQRVAANSEKSLTGLPMEKTDAGSFTVEGDSRVLYTFNRFNYKKRQNISSSFNFEQMSCTTCGGPEHKFLSKLQENIDASDQTPPCFIFTDQNNPSFLPAVDEGECLKIFRMEDATLDELVTCFVDIIEGFSIPAGTILLLSSLSQLLSQGACKYADEFRRAVSRLYRTFGDGIITMHSPMLPCFSLAPEGVRSMYDYLTWSTHYAQNYNLPETTAATINMLLNKGDSQAQYTWRGDWPNNMLSNSYQIMVSQGVKELAYSIPPTTEQVEYEIYSTLISELNSRCPVELSQEFSAVRSPSGSSAEARLSNAARSASSRIILVGSSHAARTGVQLAENEAITLIDLSDPSWRLSETDIENKKEELLNALEVPHDGPTLIVYQVLDNAVYVGRTRDGSRMPSRSPADGKFHVPGNLELLDGEQLKQTTAKLLPLLRAGGNHKKLIVAPMHRYIAAPCCDDPSHIMNFNKPAYAMDMAAGLATIRDQLRSMAHNKKISNYRVASVEKLLGWEEDHDADMLKALWGRDPVHLSPAGYLKAAKKICELASITVVFSNSKAAEPKKKEWLSANNAAVKRMNRGGGMAASQHAMPMP